jgi:hypothetical protein
MKLGSDMSARHGFRPLTDSLDGPSKTFTVEPLRVPATAPPPRVIPEPEPEPERSEPDREREPVPSR